MPSFTNKTLIAKEPVAMAHRSAFPVMACLNAVILVAVALMPATQAFAAGPPETAIQQKVSLSDLIRYAEENNPDILAATETWLAAQESYRAATSYPDPA